MISINKRIEIFELIRDIPYRISAGPDNSICSVKSKILGEILIKYGLECRIASCKFDWEDLNIPSDILLHLENSVIPKSVMHTFLQVKVPESNKWVNIDATWDKFLSPVFQIAEWNGVNNTAMAIPNKNRFKVVKDLSNKFILPENIEIPEILDNDIFLQKFNKWLINIRNK